MPTYQYACTECGYGFDMVQSFSDEALTECPSCGGRLRKVFGSVGVVFKGSGFYRNDSRQAADKASRGKGGSSGDGTDSGKDAGKGAGKDKKSEPATTTSSDSSSGGKSATDKSSSGSSSSTAGSAA